MGKWRIVRGRWWPWVGRTVPLGAALCLCAYLALKWVCGCALLYIVCHKVDVPYCYDIDPDGLTWLRHCWYLEGIILVAVTLCAYRVARIRPSWIRSWLWLVASCMVLVLAASSVVAVWFRLTAGRWQDGDLWTEDWVRHLLACAAGCLLARSRRR